MPEPFMLFWSPRFLRVSFSAAAAYGLATDRLMEAGQPVTTLAGIDALKHPRIDALAKRRG